MYVYVFDYTLDKHPDGETERTMEVLAPRKADAEKVLVGWWELFNCRVTEHKLRTLKNNPVLTDVPRSEP
jgi:hypothetical protein